MTSTSAPSRTRAWGTTDLMMLVTVMIWGLNFVAVKLVLREFSPMAFIGLRFTMATARHVAVFVAADPGAKLE